MPLDALTRAPAHSASTSREPEARAELAIGSGAGISGGAWIDNGVGPVGAGIERGADAGIGTSAELAPARMLLHCAASAAGSAQ